MADYSLDLRGVACPMNFVKTRLFIDKMSLGQSVQVLLDAGEPVESVTSSITAEGHQVEQSTPDPSGHYVLIIRKNA